jgi:soluble lytic murein transglycosylase-like protein
MRYRETLLKSLTHTRTLATPATLALRSIALTLALTGVAYAANDTASEASAVVVANASEPEALPSLADIASVLWKQFRVAQAESRRIAQAVLNASDRCAISPVLLLAVIATESGFDRHATSSVGARGLMQILPDAHPRLVGVSNDLFDPSVNVRIGSTILRGYLDATGGDLNAALRRYSGGGSGYNRRVALRMRQFEESLHAPHLAFPKVALDGPRRKDF